MRNLQARIAFARELIRQSRWAIGQQTSLKIVCAWCQQTMRWQRAEGTARGQMSHSICFDCFADVFGNWILATPRPLFLRRCTSVRRTPTSGRPL